MGDSWLNISFPKRLFVIGAGPSLEILYEHRHEANNWGDWVVLRSDLVKPLLEFIKPKYTIRYCEPARGWNKTYGIALEKSKARGASIVEFIFQFQEHGGEELFLFGFDGDSSGYWRGQTATPPGVSNAFSIHKSDCDHMNDVGPSKISIKLFHIGNTRHRLMRQISIDDLKKIYLHGPHPLGGGGFLFRKKS